MCRLQAPAATGSHNQCFQQVQEDLCRVRSVCKEWDFVSEGTELSVGRSSIEYSTPLTLGGQHQGVFSNEDVTEVWAVAKSETINKVRNLKIGTKGEEVPHPDEEEVDRSCPLAGFIYWNK